MWRVKPNLEPKYWQMTIGMPLARMLDRVIYNSGFAHKVAVVSLPREESYEIVIFRLASFGELIHEGAERRGVEFLRIEIKFPNKFVLLLTNADWEQLGFSFPSSKILVRESEEILTEILCTFWIEMNP